MPTTASEFIVAQSYIGETETLDTFDERFDRHYTVVVMEGSLSADTARREEALHRGIEESLRAQLAAMALDAPSSASADGKSYSNVQNLVTLQNALKKFEGEHGSSKIRSVTLCRPDVR